MESRGARRFETLRIFDVLFVDRETLFHRGKSFSEYCMYFRLPGQINGKMKSKLFHATAIPNGG